MNRSVALAAGFVVLSVAPVLAQPVPESVYPPPEPLVSEDPRVAQTGIHFDFEARYMTDYVWRGIERFDAGHHEDSANVQIEPRLTLDLGKLPHPYVSVFFNTSESDEVSNLQEIRPEVGFDWDIRPVTVSAGYTSYIFPDRDGIDTGEIFLGFTFDDSQFFHSERPVFHPYVRGAFDFDEFDGLYVEAGIQHAWPVEGTGLTFLFNAHVGYVNGQGLFSLDPTDTSLDSSGFQHYQVGLTARYRMNELLNIPDRFGQLTVIGYLNYTDGIENELQATTQIWGGAGISLRF
jgi:hypothetical protein